MKIYRIKIDDLFYVKGIVFDTIPEKNELKLEFIPTWEEHEAGWFEEDKAIKYCEVLNKQQEATPQEERIKFSLEEVVKDE